MVFGRKMNLESTLRNQNKKIPVKFKTIGKKFIEKREHLQNISF